MRCDPAICRPSIPCLLQTSLIRYFWSLSSPSLLSFAEHCIGCSLMIASVGLTTVRRLRCGGAWMSSCWSVGAWNDVVIVVMGGKFCRCDSDGCRAVLVRMPADWWKCTGGRAWRRGLRDGRTAVALWLRLENQYSEETVFTSRKNETRHDDDDDDRTMTLSAAAAAAECNVIKADWTDTSIDYITSRLYFWTQRIRNRCKFSYH